jgi:hypothetical protein
MATHTKTVTLTDLQQNILSNDLYNPDDNSGLDAWIQSAVDGKINNSWKRMQSQWTTKLMNDASFTDSIPSNQADFVALIIARADYLTRKEIDDSATIALETSEDTTAIVAEKQRLRDITNQVDTMTTVDELKGATI